MLALSSDVILISPIGISSNIFAYHYDLNTTSGHKFVNSIMPLKNVFILNR